MSKDRPLLDSMAAPSRNLLSAIIPSTSRFWNMGSAFQETLWRIPRKRLGLAA